MSRKDLCYMNFPKETIIRGISRVHVPGITITARNPHELIRKFDAVFREKYNESVVGIIQNNGGSRKPPRVHRKCDTSGRTGLDFTIRKQLARGRRGW